MRLDPLPFGILVFVLSGLILMGVGILAYQYFEISYPTVKSIPYVLSVICGIAAYLIRKRTG